MYLGVPNHPLIFIFTQLLGSITVIYIYINDSKMLGSITVIYIYINDSKNSLRLIL
jgi:hypothetical protein